MAFRRQIQRLGDRINRMEKASRRFSWIRLAIFLAGGAGTWLAGNYGNTFWGWFVFLSGSMLFIVVVVRHRSLVAWITKFKIWTDIRSDSLARSELDWDRIPQPVWPDSRTATSLELDLDLTGRRSLHTLLDTSLSRQGSILLADWLSQGMPDLEQIRERQGIVSELKPLTRFRDRLTLTFRLVSKKHLEGVNLLQWLDEKAPSGWLKWALPASLTLSVVNLVLFTLNTMGKLPAFWVLSLLFYAVIYFYQFNAIGEFLESVVRLDAELDKFRALLRFLETYRYGNNVHLKDLCKPFLDAEDLPSKRLRKVKLVTAAIGLRMNPFFGILLNLVFPWDLLFSSLAIHYRDQAAGYLPGWFDIFHKLEVLNSLANFAYLNPDYPFPEIVPDASPVFKASGMGHPLIPSDQRICNDFEIKNLGRLAIITGSNMAGKSTFIKTVGINLCLSYAGGPVCAQRLEALPFRLDTCIRITDSVTDGFSFFYTEVKCLKRLLDDLNSNGPQPLIYLIDEIFRGTNNRERLIGSRAYVLELAGKNGVGLLATHDLELASLAGTIPELSNYHFRDYVREGRLDFDYKIQPGACPTTNALKIMQMEGLPVETSSISHSENKNAPREAPGAGGN
jgi:hypothetical protein